MRALSLFSGIGGLDLGLHWAGFETVGWCEREPFCRRVMEHHWPGLWNHDDITTLDPDDAIRGCGGIDLIAGGFPCQPVSTAGKRRGTDDARWLWPDMARVIRGVRPAWVLAENVPGLRSLGADDVLGDLEAAGYACWAFVVGAGDVGAPHRRKRVFIVAHLQSERCEAQSESVWEQITEPVWRGNAVAPRPSFRWPMPPGPEQWYWEPPRLVERQVGGGADGLPARLAGRARREQLRALGNAVVPQVAYVLGRAIKQLDERSTGKSRAHQ